jgi:hypothetical protein
MKGVWNHVRAIDVLESLTEVDADRIGCIGHSLGGYNTIFLGVQDARVKVMVSNAGYNSFVDYAASPYGGGDLAKWSLDKHIRRIRTVYNNDPSAVPCDFPELIAALAPRPFLTIAPKQDEIFVLPPKRGPESKEAFHGSERHRNRPFRKHSPGRRAGGCGQLIFGSEATRGGDQGGGSSDKRHDHARVELG